MPIFIKSIWFYGPLGVFFSAVVPHPTPPFFSSCNRRFLHFSPFWDCRFMSLKHKASKRCTEKAIWPSRNWVNWDTRKGRSVATTFALCTSYPSKGTPWKPPQWASSLLAQLSAPKLQLAPRCTADFLSASLSVLLFGDFTRGLITLLIRPLHLLGRGVSQLEMKAHAALLLDAYSSQPSCCGTCLFCRSEEKDLVKAVTVLMCYSLKVLCDLICILIHFYYSCKCVILCALICLLFLPLRAMPV